VRKRLKVVSFDTKDVVRVLSVHIQRLVFNLMIADRKIKKLFEGIKFKKDEIKNNL